MPIAMLYVEGRVDTQVLTPLMNGWPAVIDRGTKGDLPHIVRQDRKYGQSVCYLRDRDFDSEPPSPADQIVPTVDRRVDGVVHGFRWVRHSIESYILDPQIAEAVARINPSEWRAAIEVAAASIKNYQAGRWAIAQIREGLPRPGRLVTRPVGIDGEFQLPQDLSEVGTWSWVNASTSQFRADVSNLVAPASVRQKFDEYLSKLPVAPCAEVLLWYSGKDLLASIQPFLASKGFNQAFDYVQKVIAWIRMNSDAVLPMFPEWQALKNQLNT